MLPPSREPYETRATIKDNWIIGEYLADLLRKAGASSTVMAATEDGAVALACDHAPALIVSDIHLAHGNGPCAVARIRKIVGPTPVIYIAGHPDDAPIGDDIVVMAKPVEPALLLHACRLAPILTAS